PISLGEIDLMPPNRSDPMPPTPAPPNAGRRVRRTPLLVAALTGTVAVVLVAFWFAGYGGSSARPSYGSPAAVHRATSPAPEVLAEVDIVNFRFTPAEVTVKAGTTIRWT